MSDFFDKTENELEQPVSADENVGEAQKSDDAESTVFSAPVEHKDKSPKKAGKKRLFSIIAACLAVAVLVGGTLAVIKLIPEMTEDEAPESIFEDITVIDSDSTAFSSVTVKNSNGEFKFITQTVNSTQDENAESTSYWTVEGVDYSKLSTTSMNSVVSSAASVSATREVDKIASECGFDEPKIKVTVTSTANDPYTFIVGDESPDGLGVYLTVEGSDTIYIAPESEFTDFEFSLLDLTDKTSIPATTFTVDTSENKVADGTYAYFDSLVLSGKSYPETVTVVNSPASEDISSTTPYMITTPMQRFADTETLTPLIYLFSQEISVSGNYALDVTDETLKLFGLDNPDIVATMTIKGESKTFKISKVDSAYCAVVYDGATMIRKVAVTDLSFLDNKTENYYNKSVCLYPRTNVANLVFADSESTVEFDITYEEDDNSNKTYYISANGTDITEKDFTDFYREFLTVQCSNFAIDEISAEPDSTISFTFFSGNKSVIKFYRAGETEYQYSIDDIPMGKIPSATYNKLVKNLKTVAEGGSLS